MSRILASAIMFAVVAVASAAEAQPDETYNDAYALWQKGDCVRAEAGFRRVLANDPINAAANYYYADCLAQRGDLKDAIMPLRLAVQYGGDSTEGRMAQQAAKSIADQTSPAQGIDDGCAIPVAPTAINGTVATKDEMQEAHERVVMFIAASDQFQSCVQETLAELRQQAGQSGHVLSPRVENKLQGPVDTNQQEKQAVGDQFNTALAAFNATHPN